MSLDKKILFFARDPGGASPLVSFISSFTSAKVYAQDYAIEIFKNNNIPYQSISNIEDLLPKLKNFKLLVTGTSYLSNSDKELWLEAKKLNIQSVAYFDHWMNFKRFFHTDKNIEIFPNFIIVIDEIAKAGILKNNPTCTSKILTLGSAFLEEAIKQKTSVHVEKNTYLYAAEKIKGYEIEKEYGINEFTQFELLLNTLEKSNKKTKLFFRPHPKHNKDKIEKYLSTLQTTNCTIALDTSSNKYPLLNSIDALFGINSMVLAEGLMLGKKVCSIGNNLKKLSSFELINKKFIFSSKTKQDLKDFINGKVHINPYDISHIKNSKRTIINFLESL